MLPPSRACRRSRRRECSFATEGYCKIFASACGRCIAHRLRRVASLASEVAKCHDPIPMQFVATGHWTNGRGMRRDESFRDRGFEFICSVNDERQITTRDEHFGTMAATYRARLARTRPRHGTRVVAATIGSVPPQSAAQLHDAPWQRAFEPVDRRPARSPVLGQDYGRRPHRCLQSGSRTSRRP